MYAQRLGRRAVAGSPTRWARCTASGVALAFGSDSPVTPLDPWGTVRAAMRHHNPAHRMSARAAFAAHTRGGWRAVHRDDEGVLAPGAPATFAVWDGAGGADRRPAGRWPTTRTSRLPALPVCRRTVLRGDVDLRGGDRDDRQAGSRPGAGARGPAALAARAGQPVVDLARSHTTVVGGAGGAAAGRGDRRRPGRHPVGEPAGRRGRRATSGWATAWRCRCSHALRPRGHRPT